MLKQTSLPRHNPGITCRCLLPPACACSPALRLHPQYIASTITTEGAFKTWQLTNGLVLDTLDNTSGNTTVSITLEDSRDYGYGDGDHEIIVSTNAHMNRARVIRPSNIRVCKSIVHTISHALYPCTNAMGCTN